MRFYMLLTIQGFVVTSFQNWKNCISQGNTVSDLEEILDPRLSGKDNSKDIFSEENITNTIRQLRENELMNILNFIILEMRTCISFVGFFELTFWIDTDRKSPKKSLKLVFLHQWCVKLTSWCKLRIFPWLRSLKNLLYLSKNLEIQDLSCFETNLYEHYTCSNIFPGNAQVVNSSYVVRTPEKSWA